MTRERRLDLVAALGLATLALALHAPVAAAALRAGVPAGHNQVFDLDPGRFVDLLARDAWSPETYDASVRVKHPGILLLRPPARALTALVGSPELACTLGALALGAATVVAVFALARRAGCALPEAATAAALLAASAAQITASTIPESYGPSALALAALWLVTVPRLRAPAAHLRARLGVAVALLAVTSTNLVQALVAETVVWWGRGGPRHVAARLGGFGAALALPLLAAALVVAGGSPRALLRDPLGPAREAVWAGVPSGGVEKAGLGQELLVLAGLSFVAPRPTEVEVASEPRPMLDFRAPLFAGPGRAAIAAWTALLAVGAVEALRAREHRRLVTALLLALAWNVALHASFQYRGSLYLVTPHVHVLLVALLLPLATRLGRAGRTARLTGLAAAWLLVLLLAWNNVARHLEALAPFLAAA